MSAYLANRRRRGFSVHSTLDTGTKFDYNSNNSSDDNLQ